MPRLKVDGKSTRTLVASLVHVSRSVVVHPEHRDNTVGRTVGPTNVGTRRTDPVNIKTNTTSGLGDHSTSLQGVIDTLDTVTLHIDKEARRQLRLGSTSVEQGWRRMGEILLGHQVVGLNCPLNVIAVDSNSNSHQEVLRALSNLSINAQQV